MINTEKEANHFECLALDTITTANPNTYVIETKYIIKN